MALPINTMPVYTLTIPSTKKQMKYRPFLVKEEKSLLIAQQSEDSMVMMDTVKAVIASCAKTPIDVDKLATFDVEYIFLQLRAISIGEIVDLMFKCDTCEDDKAKAKVTLNLQDAKVVFSEDHTTKIPLFNDVGVVMKYPTLDIIKKIENYTSTDIEDYINNTLECIDYIYTGDEIFPAADQTQEELREFVENLTADQFANVQKFFNTMPSLRQYIKYSCPVCNKQHDKYIEGLASFF